MNITMSKLIMVVLLGFAAAVSLASDSDPESLLKQYRGIYDKNMSEFETQYRGESNTCPVDYIKALQSLKVKLQDKGDLDGWEAVDTELKRFREEPVIGAERASLPELRVLQDAYVQRKAELEQDRNHKITDLTEKYVNRLTAMQRELTQAGDFDNAFAVRDEINRVNGLESVQHARAQIALEESIPDEPPPVAEDVEVAGIVKDAEGRIVQPDGSILYPSGIVPPSDKHYRIRSLDRTLQSPWPSPIAMKISDDSDSESTENERDRMLGEVENKVKEDQRYVRIELRAANAGVSPENLQIVVQYYAKPVSGSGDPRLLEDRRADISRISTQLTYIDMSVVAIKSMTRTFTADNQREFSAAEGFKFYGYVVSVLGEDGTLLYQGATTGTLGDMAEVPKLRKVRQFEQRPDAKGLMDAENKEEEQPEMKGIRFENRQPGRNFGGKLKLRKWRH